MNVLRLIDAFLGKRKLKNIAGYLLMVIGVMTVIISLYFNSVRQSSSASIECIIYAGLVLIVLLAFLWFSYHALAMCSVAFGVTVVSLSLIPSPYSWLVGLVFIGIGIFCFQRGGHWDIVHGDR